MKILNVISDKGKGCVKDGKDIIYRCDSAIGAMQWALDQIDITGGVVTGE